MKMKQMRMPKRSKGDSNSAANTAAWPMFWLSQESLCSLAIALWGWQTQLLMVAVPMLILLEARRVIKQRWELSPGDLKEVVKLSAIILLMLSVIIIFIKDVLFIYTQLQWLPVAAFPLLMAQTYAVDVQNLLQDELENPYLREHWHKLAHSRTQPFINLHRVYFALCLLAASATDSDSFFFYGLSTALVALFLWSLRPQRSAPALWLLLFCLSVGLGFAGHRQLAQFQTQLEQQVIAMLGSYWSGGAIDPTSSATQMGSIGRLKLSNKILFRVAAQENADNKATNTSGFPLLLSEATYNRYQLSTWTVTDDLFVPVPPGEKDGDWILGPAHPPESTITISTDLEQGDGILTLPQGTSNIQQLPVAEMQRNLFGAVQVDATGNATYAVQFSLAAAPFQSVRPDAVDLQIPNIERDAVQQIVNQLNLADKSERDIAQAIAVYLQPFQYSLDLIRPQSNTAPISDFLLRTKAGHCEYFASATALLLRAAGIPARYVVGYSAHEYSRLERQYIVRSRDAHAWTLAYIDGQWQTIDNTPPDWTAQEQAMTSSFQRVSDFFDFLSFQGTLRMRQLSELETREIILLVSPLFAFLLWKSARRFQGKRSEAIAQNTSISNGPTLFGLDSELYAIEQRLAEQGLQRLPAEAYRQWIARITTTISDEQAAKLLKILELHYRYRFDPCGLSEEARLQLRLRSNEWLDEFEAYYTEVTKAEKH